MRTMLTAAVLCVALMISPLAFAGLYGDPPDENHPWAIHDANRPVPTLVTPGAQPGQPASDAIVLFDGTDLSKWEADKPQKGVPSKWIVRDGILESVKGAGYIRTKQEFGDCQLHVEWATPTNVQGNSQGRGNSGVFLMGVYEVQVLDSHDNVTYADGQAASVYGQSPPLVNASRGPGIFQTYDIVFRQPVLGPGNKVERPGYLTVFHNGVLVQDHWELEGPSGHMGRTKIRAHGPKAPIKIQDHGNPVRFRNIWIRELPSNTEGDTKGRYKNPAAVAAKRKELAAKIRGEAKKIENDVDKMQKMLESLAYEVDAETVKTLEQMCAKFVAPITSQQAAEKQKGQLIGLRNSYRHLARFKIVPNDCQPKVALETLIDKHGLEKKKK